MTAHGKTLFAKTVVDATGNATIANDAGVPSTFGRLNDHAVMPLTYCYKLGPIDLSQAQQAMPDRIRCDEFSGETYFYHLGCHQQIDAWLVEARRKGEVTIRRDHVSTIMSIPGQPCLATVNFGRVDIQDPTDPKQLAGAEVEGRRQIEEGIRFFKRYLPGFKNIELIESARQIGVRESRQITGLYILTADDVLNSQQFEDVIAQCAYPIDIHEPDSDQTTLKLLPIGKHYDIPWRCLVPIEGPENLVVAGRSISATPEAMSSFRVSPSVMAIGEAAGITAALSVTTRQPIRNVSIESIQTQLIANGSVLK